MKRRTMLLLAVVLIAAAAWMLSLQESTPLAGAAPDATTSTAATENAGAPPAVATHAAAAAPNTATAPAFMNLSVRGMPPIVLPHPIDRTLTPAAARALHRRVVDLRDCSTARDPDRYGIGGDWESDTGTVWLQAAERERVLAGRRAAIERMLGACRRQGFKTSGTEFDDEPQGWVIWAIESAAASGDIGARLDAARFDRRQPDLNGVVRPLLTAAVASGDPEIVPLIGLVVARRGVMLHGRMPVESITPSGPRNQNRNTDLRAVWTLAACDLGLDCGPTSPTLDRLCLRYGLCGYPSVEAALRDGQIPEALATATEAERQWLVARIRSGQVAGMFDPPSPVPARPGGG